MKDFFIYFLGAGMEIEFSNFGLAHFGRRCRDRLDLPFSRPARPLAARGKIPLGTRLRADRFGNVLLLAIGGNSRIRP